MTAELKASRRDTTLVLSFSHPGQRNAPDSNVLAAAIETLSKAERDDAVRAVVLTGADGDFCGGIHAAQDAAAQLSALENLHGLIEALRSFPKPLIAAVEGAVIDAGFSLALACDLIVAAQSSRFAIGAAQTNARASGGAGWFLQKILPPQLVAEIFLNPESISAARLHTAGVVNRVSADGAAFDAALAWADRLSSPQSAQSAQSAQFDALKTMLNDATAPSLADVFAAEKRHLLTAS